MKSNRFLSFFNQLPKEYRPSNEDGTIFWTEFCTYFEKLTKDRVENQQVISLLNFTKMPRSLFCIIEDVGLREKVFKMFYSYITEKPISHKDTFTAVTIGFIEVLKYNTFENNFFDWKPLYEVFLHLFEHPMAFFSDPNDMILNIFTISRHLSKFFPETAVDEVFEKVIPLCSPSGNNAGFYMEVLNSFAPVRHGEALKKWFPKIQYILENISSHRIAPAILGLIGRIARYNQSIDFSCFLPGIKAIFATTIIFSEIPTHYVIEVQRTEFEPIESHAVVAGNAIGWLIIAPPTREKTIDFLLKAIVPTKAIARDERLEESSIEPFLNAIVNTLYHNQVKVSEKTNKLSDEEITKIIDPIFDAQLGIIRNSSSSELFRALKLEMVIDHSLVKRLFDFGVQCIQCLDIGSVSRVGWAIMSLIFPKLPDEPFLREALPDILEAAISNSYRDDLQSEITNTILIITSTVPFNSKNTLPGLENMDFPTIAARIVRSYCDNLKRIPSIKGKPVQTNEEIVSCISSSVYNMVESGGDEVAEAISSVITETALDPDYGHVFYSIYRLIRVLATLSDPKYLREIKDRFLALIPNTAHPRVLANYLFDYSLVEGCTANSIDDLRRAIVFLKPYTKHPKRLVQKNAWTGISSLFTFSRSCQQLRVKRKDGKPGQICGKVTDFELTIPELFDQYELAEEVFLPEIDKMMTIEDTSELLAHIRTVRFGIKNLVQDIPFWSEGVIPDFLPISHFSFFKVRPENARHCEIKERLMKATTHIIKKFPDNPTLLDKVYLMSVSMFDYISCTENNLMITRPANVISNRFYYEVNTKKLTNLTLIHQMFSTFVLLRYYVHPIPYTPAMEDMLEAIIRLGTSQYDGVQAIAADYMYRVGSYYITPHIDIIKDIMNQHEKVQNDEMVDFISSPAIFQSTRFHPKVLFDATIHILNNYNIKDQESSIKLKISLGSEILKIFDCPEKDPYFSECLEKLDILINRPGIKHKTYTQCILLLMLSCLQQNVLLTESGLHFVLEMCVHNDKEISKLAHFCFKLHTQLITDKKVTKEDYVETRKLADFEDMIGSCKLEYEKTMFSESKDNLAIDAVLDEGCGPLVDGKQADVFADAFNGEEEDLDGIELDISDPKLKMIFDALNSDQNLTPEVSAMIEGLTDSEMTAILGGGKTDVSKKTIVHIFDSLDKMKMEYPEAYRPELFQEQSAGWYMLPKQITRIRYTFNEQLEIPDKIIAELVKRVILLTDADNPVCDSAYIFFITLTFYLKKSTIDEIAKAIREVLMGQIREANVQIMTDLISSTWSRASQMDPEIVRYFFEKIVLPIVCVSSLNPSLMNVVASNLFNYIAGVPISYFTPALRITFDVITKNSLNPGAIERTMFNIMGTIIYCCPHWFFSSIDIFIEKLIKPFFNNLTKIPRSISEEYACIFIQLCESTAIPPFSPLYDDRIAEKKSEMLALFDEVLSTFDPKDKEYQVFLLSFLSYFACVTVECMNYLYPVIFKHLALFFASVDLSEESVQEPLVDCIHEIFVHPFFTFNPALLLDYWEFDFNIMPKMRAPIQQMVIRNIEQHVFSFACVLTPDQLRHLAKMARDFASVCRNESIVIAVLPIIGHALEAIGDELEKMDDLTAAGIISVATLFDQIDDKVSKALRYLADRIEETNSSMLKIVIKDFLKRHSESVMPVVADILSEFQILIAPDYFA